MAKLIAKQEKLFNDVVMIDYKTLLQKYMFDVMMIEGTDFVHAFHDGDEDYTQCEIDELRRISKHNIESNRP